MIYLHNNIYYSSLILLLAHVATDIFAVACLHPIVFVALSSAGPFVALIMTGERIGGVRLIGIVCIVVGVMMAALFTTESDTACCEPKGTFWGVLGAGCVSAVVLARQIYKEITPTRGTFHRIFFIACISTIATANLVVMETITHCKRPELAAASVALLGIEIACVKQSLRVSPLSQHIPSAFGFYQIGGIAVASLMFSKQSMLPLAAPMLLTVVGIYILVK